MDYAGHPHRVEASVAISDTMPYRLITLTDELLARRREHRVGAAAGINTG